MCACACACVCACVCACACVCVRVCVCTGLLIVCGCLTFYIGVHVYLRTNMCTSILGFIKNFCRGGWENFSTVSSTVNWMCAKHGDLGIWEHDPQDFWGEIAALRLRVCATSQISGGGGTLAGGGKSQGALPPCMKPWYKGNAN